ncbi:hypothetical protein C5167_010229, partial [Papaver somniferum]
DVVRVNVVQNSKILACKQFILKNKMQQILQIREISSNDSRGNVSEVSDTEIGR